MSSISKLIRSCPQRGGSSNAIGNPCLLLPRFVASHVNPTSQQNLNLSEFADQPAPTALHPSATGLFIFLQGSANHSMPIGAAPWGGLVLCIMLSTT
jgi:hypothetical protein